MCAPDLRARIARQRICAAAHRPSRAAIAIVPRKMWPPCSILSVVSSSVPPLRCCWIITSSIGPATTLLAAPANTPPPTFSMFERSRLTPPVIILRQTPFSQNCAPTQKLLFARFAATPR